MEQEIEPLAVTIYAATQITGEPRTKIYEGLKTGKLKAKKSGRRTLILYGSLQQYITELSDAKFKPPKQQVLLAELEDSL